MNDAKLLHGLGSLDDTVSGMAQMVRKAKAAGQRIDAAALLAYASGYCSKHHPEASKYLDEIRFALREQEHADRMAEFVVRKPK
jgi:hypothetical protein